MTWKIAVAEVAQETDTFSPIVATRSDFEVYGLYEGAEILEKMAGVGPLGGFLEEVQAAGNVELVPIIRAWAAAGGTITSATIESLLHQLTEGIQRGAPYDAVFLSLHGAAASDLDDDVEGLVLESVRRIVGPHTPIVCPMDHHANVTQRMVDNADALIGHETQPHDTVATGRKAARVLLDVLRSGMNLTMAWRKIPMLTPQDQFLTSSGPMKQWFDRAREMEQQEGVIDVSPYPMQPWLDVAEGGWSVVVHTDNRPALAEELATEMAQRAWKSREDFWRHERISPRAAVECAMQEEQDLVILSDTGDSVYGGAPGDSTVILRELIDLQVNRIVLVPVIDSKAVAQAHAAGVGATIAVSLGGKMDNVFSEPVDVEAVVLAVSTGVTVQIEDRGPCDMRSTALLAVGNVRIVVLDHRSFAINHPMLYRHLGQEIDEAHAVVVKTASNFQFFAPWRSRLIRVDAAGMTQSDLTRFEWKRVPRPIFPLDPMTGDAV